MIQENINVDLALVTRRTRLHQALREAGSSGCGGRQSRELGAALSIPSPDSTAF